MSDQITNAVQDAIQAAVVEALGGTQSIIKKLVTEVMNEKVDARTGCRPEFSSRDTIRYIDWLTSDNLREAIRRAMQQAVGERQEELIAACKREFAEGENELARKLVEGLVDDMTLHGDYRIKVVLPREEGV